MSLFASPLRLDALESTRKLSTPPKFATPTKAQSDNAEWKSCYDLSDTIAAIFPSTTRIPYPFAIPRESYEELSESQKKVVCWMWYNLFDAGRGGVLADSFVNNLSQVCQFLNGLCLPKLVFKCLVVVPSQTLDLWVSAMLQLAPRVRTVEYSGPQRDRRLAQVYHLGGVVVTSYGVAMNDIDKLAPSSGEESVNEEHVWDVIVFDQAERLKDATSKTNASLSNLQGNINLLLTSHSLITHPKDLYSLFDFACEADIFGASYGAFKDRFETPVQRAASKRADEMDRQLAAVSRVQLAELVDSQYWQNWDAIMTPGGTRRVETMPTFAPTPMPTPFKNRSDLTASYDLTSTPSFSKKQTTSRTSATSTKKAKTTTSKRTEAATGKKRNPNPKSKSLFPDVIVIDDNQNDDLGLGRFNLEDLENSISNIAAAPLSTPAKLLDLFTTAATPKVSSITTPSIVPTPTRRTPIRNLFFNSESPQKTPTQTSTSSPSSFSPIVIMDRQRLSFGRISLLDENASPVSDEEDDELMTVSNVESSSGKDGVLSSASKYEKKKSLVAMEWKSVESFLRQREIFAMKLFSELNSVIFGSRLPQLTLVWRQMKNCAGIYHTKDSSITLSKTLLTSSARLTSTLAHEMAHAATHLLDKSPNDGHGAVWQKWARIGHARYPTVVTGSVYHNYCSQNPNPNEEE